MYDEPRHLDESVRNHWIVMRACVFLDDDVVRCDCDDLGVSSNELGVEGGQLNMLLVILRTDVAA